MQVIIKCVDQRGREMDERWGIGRLPMLVPIEWAERFHAQHKLFNAAVWEFHLPLVRLPRSVSAGTRSARSSN